MRLRGKRTSARTLTVLILAAVALSSCGGPYSARNVNVPDEKLRIADDLYSRKKFTQAGMEYKDFLAVFAGDERSDFAQFRLAESYRGAREYALASVEYRILIADYGYSEYIDDAFFLEGLCAFEMTQRAERDQSQSHDALARIERFLDIFPNSPRREEALKVRGEIHDMLGKKSYQSAKLYFKRKHYGAAEIYFRKVVTEYPDTEWAGRSWYYIGYIKQSNDENDLAADAYSRAVQSKHKFSEQRSASSQLKKLSKEKSGG
ncbi:MAG: outer membrane protein assembly factor BamD [Candidatus Krumholzibacteria bacterium]|nr:outer membrane protein assembly factor BamD [Candidatus Krumholzibacteria bacterium]